MSKHTPEPWAADGNRVIPARHIDRRPAIAHMRACQEGGGDPETTANAERIAACVNACAGVPTDRLKPDWVKELVVCLELATAELNAIRARDGAPQIIEWNRGQPLQFDACAKDWWHELTERCWAALAKSGSDI